MDLKDIIYSEFYYCKLMECIKENDLKKMVNLLGVLHRVNQEQIKEKEDEKW